MASFVCTKCNRCCMNMRNLALFEWEAERLKAIDPDAGIRPAIVGIIGQTDIVLQWAMEDKGKGHCRFLKEDGCSGYPDRPLVCQAFPLVKSGLLNNDHENVIDRECPHMAIPFKKGQKLKRDIYAKRMGETYGETFGAAIRLDAARSWISDLYQFTARKIRMEGKQTPKGKMGLLEFVKRMDLMHESEIECEIKQLTRL